ncbi:DedA family protein [Streptomyces sp. HPF1205]|uniref:DedA family protein n=1 Tax=Streptomyces sp. HPF1205 TaxID=2873262 RepID=UPI001CECA4BE|nr:VTT domain-containing protein [Streptomyces sp. HPF1205]
MTNLALGPAWMNPDHLINTYGLWGVLLVVFAESGLLIGFFLPGDSLLFTTGLLVASGTLNHPLALVAAAIALAAVAGEQTGYWFGRKVGPALFRRPESKLFKRENVDKAHAFFDRHGPKAIVMACFVPIVRTFTPIVAGVSRMNYRTFATFNVLGGTLWGAGVTLLGYWLGQIGFVHKNIEAMLVLVVLVSLVPLIVEYLRSRGKNARAADAGGRAADPDQDVAAAAPRGGRHRAQKR